MRILFIVPVLLLWFLPGTLSTAHVGIDGFSVDKTIFLVRHAETCTGQGSNPDLSPKGVDRARELARVLMDTELDKVYSTPLNRTMGTATPVAESQELSIHQTTLESGFLSALADDIKSSTDEFILVAGHSNTTPALINLLLGTEMDDLSESDFDRLFVVTLHQDGTGNLAALRYGLPSDEPEPCLP